MKLPRYTTGRSNTAELERQRAGVVSPQLAANVQMARAGVATAVLDTAASVLDEYDMRVSEEDFNAAKAEYTRRMGELDEAFDNRPLTDAQGNLAYDPLKLPEEEKEERQKIIADIRSRVRGGRGQAMFDQWAEQEGANRDVDYYGKSLDLNNEFLKARGNADVDDLVANDQYDAASARVGELQNAGVYSRAEAEAKEKEVGRARDDFSVYDALNRNAPDEELEAISERLTEGTHEDGTDYVRDEKERYALKSAIDAELNRREREATADRKQVQNSVYVGLFQQAHTQEGLDSGTVLKAYANNLLSDSQKTELLGMSNSAAFAITTDNAFDRDTVERTYNALITGEPKEGETFDDQMNAFILELGQLRLKPETQKTWTERARQALDDIHNNQTVKDLRRAAFTGITGKTETTFVMEMDESYDTASDAAYQFQRDITEKALDLGPQRIANGELEDWYNKQLPVRRIEFEREELGSIGVTVPWNDEEGFTEQKATMAQQQMAQWFSDHENPAEAAEKIKDVIGKLGGTGLILKQPEYTVIPDE